MHYVKCDVNSSLFT